jgi:hypothetical protein
MTRHPVITYSLVTGVEYQVRLGPIDHVNSDIRDSFIHPKDHPSQNITTTTTSKRQLGRHRTVNQSGDPASSAIYSQSMYHKYQQTTLGRLYYLRSLSNKGVRLNSTMYW